MYYGMLMGTTVSYLLLLELTIMSYHIIVIYSYLCQYGSKLLSNVFL